MALLEDGRLGDDGARLLGHAHLLALVREADGDPRGLANGRVHQVHVAVVDGRRRQVRAAGGGRRRLDVAVGLFTAAKSQSVCWRL